MSLYVRSGSVLLKVLVEVHLLERRWLRKVLRYTHLLSQGSDHFSFRDSIKCLELRLWQEGFGAYFWQAVKVWLRQDSTLASVFLSSQKLNMRRLFPVPVAFVIEDGHQ